MHKLSKSGLIGAALIGTGCGLAVIGIALLGPACASWSMDMLERAVQKGRESLNSGIETAASFAGQVAGKAQGKFGEAAKTARQTTAKAAGAVETAARHVREYAS